MYTYIYVHPASCFGTRLYIQVYKLSICMTHIQTTTLYTKGIVLAFMYKTESLIQVADSEFRKPNIKTENSNVQCLYSVNWTPINKITILKYKASINTNNNYVCNLASYVYIWLLQSIGGCPSTSTNAQN